MSGLTLTGQWEQFVKSLDPKLFEQRLNKRMGIASERIGRQFQRRVRAQIRAGIFEPNSPVTIAIKGSSKPLVAGGDLFQAVSFDVVNPTTVRVGVVRQRSGDEMVNIALVLHEGATIDVGKHPAVRRAVFAKMRRSMKAGGNKRVVAARKKAAAQLAGGGSGAKDVWVIPGRPFLGSVLEDAAFRTWARKEWAQGVKDVLTGKSL